MVPQQTSFYLNTPMPGWVLFFSVLVILLFCFFVFKIPQTVPLYLRRTLCVIRCTTTVLLFFLILKPSIEKENIQVKRDKTAFLIDVSKSMSIQDVVVKNNTQSRTEVASQLLKKLFTGSGETNNNPIITFGTNTTLVNQGDNFWINLEDETKIDPALRLLLKTTVGVPIKDVIVISDGNFNDSVSPRTIDELVSRGICVQTIPIGSKNTLTKVRLGDLDAPKSVYMGDKIPFKQTIFSNKRIPTISLKIKDMGTGDIIWESMVDSEQTGPGVFSVSGSFSINRTGSRRLEFVFKEPPGFHFTNQSKGLDLNVIDKPIKTLYVEGYPRWFYRFFVGDMVREKSIELSSFLVSADVDFIQDGNTSLSRLPKTKEEMGDYDLIVLGDVSPQELGGRFLELVKQRVDSGGSLCWIPGYKNQPSVWSNTNLEKLWPAPPNSFITQKTPVQIKPTESSKRLGVMGLVDGKTMWPLDFTNPKIEWSKVWNTTVFLNKNLRPGCDVLATSINESQEKTGSIVVFMPYGSGSILMVGVNETWRWRRGVGSRWTERFWISLFRMLSRGVVNSNDWSLKVTPQQVLVGDKVLIELDHPPAVDINDLVVTIMGVNDGVVDYVNFKDGGAVQWVPNRAGSFLFQLEKKPLLEKKTIIVSDRVEEMLAETKREDLLFFVSEKTGGSVFSINNFLKWWNKRKNNEKKVITTTTQEVWRSPFIYSFLVFCMFLDWLIRRKYNLI